MDLVWMYKQLSSLLTLGLFFLGQSTVIKAQNIPPQPQIINGQQLPQPSISEMLIGWGYTPTNCQENTVQIRHKITGEIACVSPNEKLGAGKFVYDPQSNQIRPENNSNLQANSNNQASLGHTNPIPQNKDPRIAQMSFSFNSLHDYGNCVDAILLAYEGQENSLRQLQGNKCVDNFTQIFGTQISSDIALQLIDSANFYATNLLQTTLYPLYGLRRQVTKKLGYVYEIDSQNSEILQYVR